MRLGFNSNKEKTLEEVGQTFNMTRERVRQIENKIFTSLKKNNYSSIYIKKIKEYLEINVLIKFLFKYKFNSLCKLLSEQIPELELSLII